MAENIESELESTEDCEQCLNDFRNDKTHCSLCNLDLKLLNPFFTDHYF